LLTWVWFLQNSGDSSSREALESEQKNMGTQRISVSDHINAFQYSADEADSFVIDMDSFSPPTINKDSINTNSRITVRSFFCSILNSILPLDNYFILGIYCNQSRIGGVLFFLQLVQCTLIIGALMKVRRRTHTLSTVKPLRPLKSNVFLKLHYYYY